MKKIVLLIPIIVIITILSIDSANALHSNFKGEVPVFLSQYLSDNGLENGTINANGDYASTPTDFYIQPPSNETYRLSRILITIGDTGITNADDYGAISNGLTNGIQFYVEENGLERRVNGDLNTFTNGDYLRMMYDFNCDSGSLANGLDYCIGRWTFDKSGTVIRLNGATNDKFIVRLNDTFTGLDQHYFKVQGYKELSTETTNENIEDDVKMIGISLLLIAFSVMPIYIAKNLKDKDEKGSVLKTVSMVKILLFSITFFSFFLLIQTAFAIAISNSLNDSITKPIGTLYQFTISILTIMFFIVLYSFMYNLYTNLVPKRR